MTDAVKCMTLFNKAVSTVHQDTVQYIIGRFYSKRLFTVPSRLEFQIKKGQFARSKKLEQRVEVIEQAVLYCSRSGHCHYYYC